MTCAFNTLSKFDAGNRRIFRSIATASRGAGLYRPSDGDFTGSFPAVLRRWKSETAFMSDPDMITEHPSFRAIVDNARIVLPLIIDELRSGASLLVWALEDATGERPYADQDRGNIEAMSEAWIAWAEKNGRAL